MPVLRPSGSDFTSFVKAAAQYVPPGRSAKVSKSGGVSVALPGLGAFVRASQVGALASPTTSAVIINGITSQPPPVVVPAVVPPGKTLPISVGQDAFIVKYDTSGVAQWATAISGTLGDGGRGIATDSTGTYVTGSYRSASVVTLNNGITLPISVQDDAFIVKYDTSGLAQWATRISGTVSDLGYAIATDSTGVYVTGQYRSASLVTLNNGITLPITVVQDAFIVKYNTSGLAQWATRISGTSVDTGDGIATDSTGVYVSGYYTSISEITLNNGITLPISQGGDAFIIKYDTSGLAQWATTISGTGSDVGNAIATDSTGVYVTGPYSSTSAITLTNGI